MSDYKLHQGNCLELMKKIPDNSIDMVLADLPYGTTQCSWDSIIPLDKLWKQYKRIGKDNTPYVFTASQPFTTKLIQSNMDWFKYCWYWNKQIPSGMSFAKYQPMRQIEEVVVFADGKTKYNPQMIKRDEPIKAGGNNKSNSMPGADGEDYNKTYEYKNPINILEYKKIRQNSDHPTQKPVALFEYLIKTYTDKGGLVLDNVMGSGTTGVACQKTGRRFLGIEQDEEYFRIAENRIGKAKNTDWERVEGIQEWQQFDGIGEKTATDLYDELGSVDNADMDSLESVSGIGQNTADNIREADSIE